MSVSKVATSCAASPWVLPLGQIPDYLDPQSQEALYEVDVSGTALFFSLGDAPEGEDIGSMG